VCWTNFGSSVLWIVFLLSEPKPISAGIIAGAVVGSIFGALAMVVLIAFLAIRRRHRNNSHVREVLLGRLDHHVVESSHDLHDPFSDSAVSEADSEPPPYMTQVMPSGTNDRQPGSYSELNLGSSPSVSSRDALSTFAESHRDVIPSELENKLRQAGYQPHLDPDMVSNKVWSQAGVGPFSLQILREIYQR
jgi:hypothetical protein